MVEFKNSDELKTWLAGQPRQFSVVIASRAALRVVLYLGELFDLAEVEATRSGIFLAVFRALALPFAASKYPVAGKELFVDDARIAVDAAADTARAAYAAFAAGYAVEDSVFTFNAVDAVDTAAFAVDAIYAFNAVDAADAAYAAGAAAGAVHATDSLASYVAADSTAVAAYATDVSLLEAGMAPEELVRRPLLLDQEMGDLVARWRDLKNKLLALKEDWQVWTGWYEDILAGRNRANLPDVLARDLDLKIARQDNEWWQRGAAAVNRDIAVWTEEAREKAFPPPREPAAGPGPQYAVLEGKLSEVAQLPQLDEAEQQAGLHQQIKKLVGELAGAVVPLGNRFPALANAAREYAELVASELEDLDVVAVWAVGGALASFAQSYREQNINRTLGEPLEPNVEAMLQNIVRVHGAFILGFAQGRNLVERADAFALDRKRLAEIGQSGNVILGELTDNRELVEERTRDLHRPVRDVVDEFGWKVPRNGYSGYLIVRNATRVIIKGTIGDNPTIASVVGLVAGVSILAGDPNMEFARAAIPFLQYYGSQLLIFFNHSPEMRAYVEWALRLLDEDERRREDDQD